MNERRAAFVQRALCLADQTADLPECECFGRQLFCTCLASIRFDLGSLSMRSVLFK